MLNGFVSRTWRRRRRKTALIDQRAVAAGKKLRHKLVLSTELHNKVAHSDFPNSTNYMALNFYQRRSTLVYKCCLSYSFLRNNLMEQGSIETNEHESYELYDSPWLI